MAVNAKLATKAHQGFQWLGNVCGYFYGFSGGNYPSLSASSGVSRYIGGIPASFLVAISLRRKALCQTV